jgi:hypothetical protein
MTIATAFAHPQNIALARRRASRAANVLATDAPLTKAQIAGALSLIDQRSLTIAPERGFAVRVVSGFLSVAQAGEDSILGAGDRFVAEGSGLVVLSALETTELRVEWS